MKKVLSLVAVAALMVVGLANANQWTFVGFPCPSCTEYKGVRDGLRKLCQTPDCRDKPYNDCGCSCPANMLKIFNYGDNRWDCAPIPSWDGNGG